jgi:diguanylate cyclase (GGDEF)-like protein
MSSSPNAVAAKPFRLALLEFAHARARWVKRNFKRYTRAQGEAFVTALSITVGFLAIIHFEMGAWVFAQFEHEPDAKRDAAILAGAIVSTAFGIFAARRWRELSREVTQRTAAEARATALAGEDVLTNLPNRRALAIELQRAIGRSKRTGECISLLLLDLDRFKPINDVHGHVAGDQVLQEIALRLRRSVRVSEYAARLGGDEFAVVVVHDANDPHTPLLAAGRIADSIARPFQVGSDVIDVGVTTGLATYPSDADSADALMQRADIALNNAKQGERGRIRSFNLSMDVEIRERATIEAELRSAIAANQVVPFFQPLIDLKTGHVRGFEALARWPHPTRGFIPPVKFIPIAEERRMIGDLTTSMLTQACNLARDWPGEPILSVNVSPVQLTDRGLAVKLLEVLRSTGFAPHRLEVEITESALVSDFEGAHAILGDLKTAGVTICLDDFGAGYSSLSHLSSMPFDRVKIDRAFIQLDKGPGQAAKVMGAIVGMCRNLGLEVTGEGAETAQQCQILIDAGCSVGQGWYFGAAVSACDARKLAHNPDLGLAPWKGASAAGEVNPVVALKQYLRSPRETGGRARS